MQHYFGCIGRPAFCLHSHYKIFADSYKQAKTNSRLFQTVLHLDQQLFGEGFNQCKIDQLANLIDEGFEFYHNTAGTNTSKVQFVSSFPDGLCKINYRAERELIAGSAAGVPAL